MNKNYNYQELVELIENRDFEPVKSWLKTGGDPNLGVNEDKTSLTMQVIYELFEEGDTNEVLELLELFLVHGAETNPPVAGERGLLFEALASGNNQAVKLLVEHGADCNVIREDFPKQTPLICAVEKNDTELVKLLLPRTSSDLIHFVGGYLVAAAMSYAFRNLNEEIIHLLLEAGANPYFKEWDHAYYYSVDLIGECTEEQRKRINDLVEKFSNHSKK